MLVLLIITTVSIGIAQTSLNTSLNLEVITSENAESLIPIAILESIFNPIVDDIAFNNNNTSLVAVGSSGVSSWELQSNEEASIFILDNAVASVLSKDANYVLCKCSDNPDLDDLIQVWNILNGEQMIEFEIERVGNTLAFDNSAQQFATSIGATFTDYAIQVWDVDGRIITSWEGYGWASNPVFSPDDKTLAVVYNGGDINALVLWNIEDGSEVVTLEQRSSYEPNISWIPLDVASAAFNSDGSILASINPTGSIWLWDVATGEEIRHMINEDVLPDTTQALYPDLQQGVIFSPDDSLIVSLGGEVLSIWDVATGNHLLMLDHQASIVVFSADGKLIATTNQDNTITLWGVRR